jgi:hypothetical protein
MKLMKQITLVFCLLFASLAVKADEGMWLPQLLAKLNERQMKAMGMKISAADIYNINKGSLKDAIVSFSSKRSHLTNHYLVPFRIILL